MRHTSASVLPESVRSELKRLGELARGIRLARRLSQADVASRLRVSIPTIQRLEKGGTGTSLGTFLAILWILDLAMPSRPLEAEMKLKNLSERQRARQSRADRGLEV